MHTQAAGRLKGRKTPKVVRLVVVYEEFSERELFLLLFFFNVFFTDTEFTD